MLRRGGKGRCGENERWEGKTLRLLWQPGRCWAGSRDSLFDMEGTSQASLTDSLSGRGPSGSVRSQLNEEHERTASDGKKKSRGWSAQDGCAHELKKTPSKTQTTQTLR